MRTFAKLLLIAVGVTLIGTTVVEYQNYRRANANYLEMKASEESARAQYAEAFNAIAEIQDSLNAIQVSEGAVHLRSGSLESERKLTEPSRREVMESIASLNTSIQRTKEMIEALEVRLNHSTTQVAGLKKMVGQLKTTLVERETQVAALTGQVNELQTQVTGLQQTVEQNQETITAKDQALEADRREMGTVYYLIGTKQQLASAGVVVTKGGVLGMGKTLQLSGRFDDHLFKPLDTDAQNVIRTTASKAQVLSAQPVTSYELKIEGKEVELRILNAAEFRKVKHVVIVTA